MKNGNNVRDRKNENFDYEKGIETSMRNENDALIGNLLQNMKNIKGIAHKIKSNIKLSNNLVEETDKKYSETGSIMSGTIKRLGDVLSANSGYWCYLIIFLFIVFFILYKITT